MNDREAALNSQRTKTRDKNGIEITPVYTFQYNQYERQKQLNQVDRVMSRQYSPMTQINYNRSQSIGNYLQNGYNNNMPSSSTLSKNGSQLISRGHIPSSSQLDQQFINNQSPAFSNNNPVQSQKFINQLQNHANNFSQIRINNQQYIQNPQLNYNGAQFFHKNNKSESNYIKDQVGLNSNHGYNILSGHVQQN